MNEIMIKKQHEKKNLLLFRYKLMIDRWTHTQRRFIRKVQIEKIFSGSSVQAGDGAFGFEIFLNDYYD